MRKAPDASARVYAEARPREEVRDLLVEVAGVTKRYGAVTALAAFDLEIRRGEVLGLLGPNGAGKTTLMHLLAGVLRPDAGTIRMDGLDDPSQPRVRRAIGLAPQALAVYPQLTAEENLRFFGGLYGVRRAALATAVADGLALADLAGRAAQRSGTFSGGMNRRLNLACALVHRPSLLLLDEPTAGVDPQSRHHLFEAIRRLHGGGLTVVYSTHLMEEAEQLCERVAIVDHGRLLAVGATADVLVHHAAPDLQSLFLRLTGTGMRD